MRRLTARLLLLVLLLGTFSPVALALSAQPRHACCVRKKPHCHNTLPTDPDGLAIYAPSCAQRSCCRALSLTHWAQPQPSHKAHPVPHNQLLSHLPQVIFAGADLAAAHTVRGPPEFSLA